MPFERILALCHRIPHQYQPKELAVVGQLMQRTPFNSGSATISPCAGTKSRGHGMFPDAAISSKTVKASRATR